MLKLDAAGVLTFSHCLRSSSCIPRPTKERIFTWFSLFSSLCKLINVKPSDITSEAFVLPMEKLCDSYIQYWSDRIKMFSKIDTYCLLKQRFGFENYIRDCIVLYCIVLLYYNVCTYFSIIILVPSLLHCLLMYRLLSA